jgi:hypothetical protein
MADPGHDPTPEKQAPALSPLRRSPRKSKPTSDAAKDASAANRSHWEPLSRRLDALNALLDMKINPKHKGQFWGDNGPKQKAYQQAITVFNQEYGVDYAGKQLKNMYTTVSPSL